jgi:hypothetical protein
MVIKFQTAVSLGIVNLCRALRHRLGVKLGINSVRRLKAITPQGDFFISDIPPLTNLSAPTHWQRSGRIFSHYPFSVSDAPPDWHSNPLTGVRIAKPKRDWWLIPDFDPAVGDIKIIWELSRFDWVLAYAQQTLAGDTKSLERLNNWLNDWCQHNPPFKGPNWKCGQEASIRVMHLAMAGMIMDQVESPSKALVDIIEVHLQRITPTISYAMAQDNNHGTSEAAALYIGGSWLEKLGRPKGARWAALGLKWLENRSKRLISEDGSFSQYSLNYHRVMLDTFSMVEVWRQKLSLPEFSTLWYKRAQAATHWQYLMTNPWNGDGPNLGANDGARLLQLSESDYRDFRPSVQLASALFTHAKAYSDEGVWNHPLIWLGLATPRSSLPEVKSQVFDQGGFALLCDGDAKAVLRYPRFRFRPSQADALHLDLWLRGRNLLRDAGTYSYNTKDRWLKYFPGTESHNTIQFDDRDQMPRLSRFLFGDWLQTSVFKPLSRTTKGQMVTAGYKDRYNVQHTRTVYLSSCLLRVTDEVNGFKEKAILRWRLDPSGDWRMGKGLLTNGSHIIKVVGDMPINRCELVEGWESRFYQEKQPVPVLEVEVNQSGVLTTEYRWSG